MDMFQSITVKEGCYTYRYKWYIHQYRWYTLAQGDIHMHNMWHKHSHRWYTHRYKQYPGSSIHTGIGGIHTDTGGTHTGIGGTHTGIGGMHTNLSGTHHNVVSNMNISKNIQHPVLTMVVIVRLF